jgi:hypothetical protein
MAQYGELALEEAKEPVVRETTEWINPVIACRQ